MNNTVELFSYLESFTNLEKTQVFSGQFYRLDRMQTLLTLFQDPQFSYKTIHVAGTKGKGSTAAFIASILTEHGYKTGLYASPHVSSYEERITVDNKFPHDKILLNLGNSIQKVIRKFDKFFPTTFELLTLLAFCYFREIGCDFVVVEVGIGGRLDATNLILPKASVITPIGLEHTDVLGNTLGEIAFEKAGIIKNNVPVFSGYQQEEVKEVLMRVGDQHDTKVTFLDEQVEEIFIHSSIGGTQCKVRMKGQKSISFSLLMSGDFQAENACLAFITLSAILTDMSLSKMKTGINNTKLPGRFEIIKGPPPIILDGAHTSLAITRILSSFKKLFPDKGILLFGSVKGKDHEKMVEILAPEFDHIIISTPGFFKDSDPEALFRLFKAIKTDTLLEKCPETAFKMALSIANKKLPILVTGSFYMVAEIRKLFY